MAEKNNLQPKIPKIILDKFNDRKEQFPFFVACLMTKKDNLLPKLPTFL